MKTSSEMRGAADPRKSSPHRGRPARLRQIGESQGGEKTRRAEPFDFFSSL